ncbi:hypothetical protein J8L70_10270 [Pseudoalteromonas sp. MMG010]|uniref:hypothetical protein n=1 Tax=Pseudoalteromonas sp. MMG010 TaxID=2822685 RepID=UPI001B39F06B|nr:hypothetical protein [Pseudoalteromonas sp. MMG010]MBQ4833625.1 hypothetical protein [Pseudoalteromonas sp. MMG010]
MGNNNGPGGKVIIFTLIAVCVLVVVVQIAISPSEPVYPAPYDAPKSVETTQYIPLAPTSNKIENPQRVAPIKTQPAKKRRVIDINDIEDLDTSVAHQWHEVKPTSRDLKLCRDMQLTPIAYTNEDGSTGFDYLTLTLIAWHNGKTYPLEDIYGRSFSESVSKALYDNLEQVYLQYIKWFGAQRLSKTDITIYITNSREQYINALLDNGADDSINSLGVYLPQKHKAFVNIPYTTDKRFDSTSFMSTLTHEGTHAINFVQFGYMHRWAQEGLAEYFEFLSNTDTPELALSYKQWQVYSDNLGEPFTLADLIYQNEKWSQNKGALYTTSLIYMQYFSSLSLDNNPLVNMLIDEMLPRCSTIDKSKTIDILDSDGLLSSNMYEWFSHNVIHYKDRAIELAEKERSKSK